MIRHVMTSYLTSSMTSPASERKTRRHITDAYDFFLIFVNFFKQISSSHINITNISVSNIICSLPQSTDQRLNFYISYF